MKQWTSDVILCTDGASELSLPMRERLQQNGIPICADRITKWRVTKMAT